MMPAGSSTMRFCGLSYIRAGCGHAKDLLQLCEDLLQKNLIRREHDCEWGCCDIKARETPSKSIGGNVRTVIRKVIIGTASVIALSVAGEIASSALDYAADANTATAASMPAPTQTSNDALSGDAFRKDDIRWAQLELRHQGLYRGSLDGILGPETRRAVSQFQAMNGLSRTASLDAQTWDALTGNPAIGDGSSTPGPSESSTAGDLGR
jgi:Putative peptidoglycan binding domain